MATTELAPVAEETLEFPPVRVDKKSVINQQGKDFVLFSGLIDALHQLSLGFFSVDTRIEQLPTAENGHQAVCSALVRVYDPDNPDVVRRSCSGIGDASPANVNWMMANALIRMAETRAKARALRDLLNVGMVAFEELGPPEAERRPEEHQEPAGGAPPRSSMQRPAGVSAQEFYAGAGAVGGVGVPPGGGRQPEPAPVERIMIEGTTYTRPQVEAAYKKRLEQAKAAGLALGEVATVPIERTPLAILAGKSQEIKRRLEAKGAAK